LTRETSESRRHCFNRQDAEVAKASSIAKARNLEKRKETSDNRQDAEAAKASSIAKARNLEKKMIVSHDSHFRIFGFSPFRAFAIRLDVSVVCLRRLLNHAHIVPTAKTPRPPRQVQSRKPETSKKEKRPLINRQDAEIAKKDTFIKPTRISTWRSCHLGGSNRFVVIQSTQKR